MPGVPGMTSNRIGAVRRPAACPLPARGTSRWIGENATTVPGEVGTRCSAVGGEPTNDRKMLLSLMLQITEGAPPRSREGRPRREDVSRLLPAWQPLRHSPQNWPTEGPGESFAGAARVGEPR